MKNSIGTFEAKTHFTKLITQVMAGEEILITRRGRAVAKIIPIEKTSNAEAIKAAVLRLRNLAKEMRLGEFNWEEWKSYRDEGKR
ncbi:Type II toxin-antitoxin system Phd/YefM family antitoxin (plasmid) [Candidatus Trichorickettsia mobilis]|uniref:type II toxin-antitoxin system Phd/YefM family antitoxin n=1 Tax=Candidatus Trichorickettsia mobilis TaxID=1346319 RepID=UPI002B263B33|nr:type II toxin-antitoxin system prevent-host-death family antitoxin [Candidatus Trichorickettsia mobilis]WPY01772.1 Type II toxin-antitoxin system Phd/YefM family antitoxin [Candidatus Trichorickettsia mobilis]